MSNIKDRISSSSGVISGEKANVEHETSCDNRAICKTDRRDEIGCNRGAGDYAWVSLAGPHRTTRPDNLENVRILDKVPMMHAAWKVADSRMDNCRRWHQPHIPQTSSPKRSSSLLSHDAFNWRFYHPRHFNYIQPRFGLEIAVNGISGYPQAKMMSRYLQNTYTYVGANPVTFAS